MYNIKTLLLTQCYSEDDKGQNLLNIKRVLEFPQSNQQRENIVKEKERKTIYSGSVGP